MAVPMVWLPQWPRSSDEGLLLPPVSFPLHSTPCLLYFFPLFLSSLHSLLSHLSCDSFVLGESVGSRTRSTYS